MFSEFSLRKKIIFSQVLFFFVFIAALFPIVEKIGLGLVRESLEESTHDVIDYLQAAANEQDMVRKLKKQENFVFFRISLINAKKEVIYDTHLSRVLGKKFEPYTTGHKEVAKAFEEGSGFVIAFSKKLNNTFAYVAESFTFQGKTYVLRTAFPYGQIQDLTGNFEVGLLIFAFAALLIFNAVIWLIFSRFTKPLRKIIDTIRPYQMGEVEELPEIKLHEGTSPNEEFNRLAITLNSLSERIKEQIENIQSETTEKEAILESLGEGVIAIDKELHVRYINFIASKMLKISHKALLGNPFPSTLEKANKPLLKACHELLIKCQKQNEIITDSIRLGDLKKVYIDLIAAPKAHGNGAIIVMQDKTSSYKVLEMGKDFVANASHELRTPITIIKGFSETLHEMPDMSKEMRHDITEKISRNCQRMENLVQNLLQLADIENIPEDRFQECDLGSLLENCKHIVHSVYKDSNIAIDKYQDEIFIDADRDLLELALVNILDNAAKYSKAPAEISVTIKPKDEEELMISISDQGIGIPPEDLDGIFERFYRVDKTHSRRLGGAGLGLSIVKTIIQNHDGTIEATSEVGKGTIFTITLPMRHHRRM